jgi:hypothetical protein
MLQFIRHTKAGSHTIAYTPAYLVIAGWAARDEAAVKHDIEELAAIGVSAPSSVPLFYRATAGLLTQNESLEVLGPDSSGEVEPVIVSMADGLWLTVGSGTTPIVRRKRRALRYRSSFAASLSARIYGGWTRSHHTGMN